MLRCSVFLAAVATSAGFVIAPARLPPSQHRHVAPTMGLFDGLAKAFENDSSYSQKESAGLKQAAATKTCTWVGPNGQKKAATVVPGQSMRDIARGCGVRIRYDCNEGTCNKTCEANMNGSKVKICVAKMPKKDVTVKYNVRG